MTREDIYYVNEYDEPTGEVCEKYAAHHGRTKLHAAFSVYVFNELGQLLVTQRAFSKKVWPEVWTNTCCGHPRPNESREQAIARRMKYELGAEVEDIVVVLPDYKYKTPPYKGIIEHEYCPVYFARIAGDLKPNKSEVEAYQWMEWKDFLLATEQDDATDAARREWMIKVPVGDYRYLGIWSWWCKDQSKKLRMIPEVSKYISKSILF